MNDDDRLEHLRVYNEMVAHYRHLGKPEKAAKYLRMIEVVENCLSVAPITVRVDKQPAKQREVEEYCKAKVVRRTKKTN